VGNFEIFVLKDSKWVLFGASYSATLATWFKQNYPDHVTAVMLSAGPLTPQYTYRGIQK
jgi:pimeloyl-ACP methyl ester carboxylesterase